MNTNYSELPNGYTETISKGIRGVRSFRGGMTEGSLSRDQAVARLKTELAAADAVVIGAGAGLSTAAGFLYSGDRFREYFADFEEHFGFHDMYSGGFHIMQQEPEVSWAYWSRFVYLNRYTNPPKPVYRNLLDLVKDKDYFVITTNVDHQFQKAGFDKERLFYTQGDYGLFQCSTPCHSRTYDNKERIVKMVLSQGFIIGENKELIPPKNPDGSTDFSELSMSVPSDLVPCCPVCGEPMRMNLRADDTFSEDEGWHRASAAYADFLRTHEGMRILFLEIGVGMNTPVIIKYPFWQMTKDNPNAVYACLNYNEACCPEEISPRSICIGGDSAEVLEKLL